MTEEQQTFRIPNVKEDCIPSILRDFSAPVKLVFPSQTMEELSFLMAFDKDPVNKWQAAQALVSAIILERAKLAAKDKEAKFDKIPNQYILGLGEALQQDVDNALKVIIFILTYSSVLGSAMCNFAEISTNNLSYQFLFSPSNMNKEQKIYSKQKTLA